MSDWLMKTIRAEAQRLLELAADDGELRAELRALAEEILAATDVCSHGLEPEHDFQRPSPGVGHSIDEDLAVEIEAGAPQARADADEPLHELTLGRSRPSSPGDSTAPIFSARQEAVETNPASLEARCLRKAEAARWVAECQRRIREGADFHGAGDPLDQEMAGWAQKLTDGFYWMSSQTASGSTEFSILDEIAGCFDTVAESLALVQQTQGRGKVFERALQYLAEAQSALRRALQRVDIADDPDQENVHEWIRTTAARRRIYLGRHMRADDLADPAGWSSLLARVEEARTSGRKTPLQISRLDRVRHHRDRIKEGKRSEQDWSAIIETVTGLVGEGVPPSTRELRELLLPIIEDVPEQDDLPRGFRLVLREIDRFLAARSLPVETPTHHEPVAEVKEVARLLSGKSVVLIGGIRRRDSQETLRRAFGLDSLLWIETKEHQSVETFDPVIARPDVALVLLAIRWSSHGFGEVRHLCERHNKPLVRLPGGYSPNQVAAQILTQGSEQLRAARDASAIGVHSDRA
jgi:hypothetical protein